MADEAVRRLRVKVANSDYTLRGDASEEHLRAVARAVDEMMRRILAGNPRLDERRGAVLTALNLADQLLRLQQEHERLRAEHQALSAAHAVLQKEYAELAALFDQSDA
ncbi:MAG: cell division protein ZapA [Alicyclobacillus sp.]|nr:cell division protein ZapA [Alicyclobacillus sp.]